MADDDGNKGTPAGGVGTGDNGAVVAPTVEQLQADVERWKALSRTNEKRWNDVSAENAALKAAGMTDAEKAIQAAREEARTAAMAEIGTRLADAELRAQAAAAGATLPPADFLNLAKFVGTDGAVDTALVTKFVESLPKPASGPAFRQDLGLGRQGGNGVGQLTREDLSQMTPREINEARKAGKLNSLMRGEI